MKPEERIHLAERGERRFAAIMLSPALLLLALTTTAPLIYLVWQSLHDVNLAIPGLNRFVGWDNYLRMWGDVRFWGALELTAILANLGVSAVVPL